MSKRTILITGGSGKLGKILIQHFLTLGDVVIATARTPESLAALKAQYKQYRNTFETLLCNLVDEGASDSLARALADKGMYPDCLINNARSQTYLAIDDKGGVSRSNFAGEFLLDVIVPYELVTALAREEGSKLKNVVNIGSQYGSVVANRNLYDDPATQSPLQYGVAKAALAHLTKELAVRMAPDEIQVNCIAFGGVEGRVGDEFLSRYAKLCPQGRMLREDEVARPVDMLLSGGFSAMTGHILAVDGGWTVW